MALLAKRVRAAQCAPKSASTSVTPKAAAACWTAPNISRHSLCDRMASPVSGGIRGSHFYIVEARRAGAVAGADHLFRLSLAAIRNTPQHPVIAIGDGGAGIPKLSGDAAIGGILEHASAMAVFDFPGDFATELKVVTLVVDGPTAIGLHINRVADAAEDFIERLFARQQADVGHADERETCPTGGSHSAVGALLPNGGGSFARSHISNKLPVTNDVSRLRGNPFIVEREGAHAGTVFDARIANRVDQIGTVTQMIQLVERQKAHASIVGLRTK